MPCWSPYCKHSQNSALELHSSQLVAEPAFFKSCVLLVKSQSAFCQQLTQFSFRTPFILTFCWDGILLWSLNCSSASYQHFIWCWSGTLSIIAFCWTSILSSALKVNTVSQHLVSSLPNCFRTPFVTTCHWTGISSKCLVPKRSQAKGHSGGLIQLQRPSSLHKLSAGDDREGYPALGRLLGADSLPGTNCEWLNKIDSQKTAVHTHSIWPTQ